MAAEDVGDCSKEEHRNQPGPNAPLVSRLNSSVATALSTERVTDWIYSDVAHTSKILVGFEVGCVLGCVDGTREGCDDGLEEGLVDGDVDGCMDGWTDGWRDGDTVGCLDGCAVG